VAQALRHIEQVMVRGAPPSRGIVARRMGYSESTLHRRLQAQGASFQGLVDVQRLNHARQSLANGEASVSMLSQRLGFSSPQVFSRWFRQQTGFSPGQYRDKTVAVPG
jgi:AraC-like DNA-binding protein